MVLLSPSNLMKKNLAPSTGLQYDLMTNKWLTLLFGQPCTGWPKK